MLKQSRYKGLQWQFEEGKQPAEAVEIKAADPPKNKAKKTPNKCKAVKKK